MRLQISEVGAFALRDPWDFKSLDVFMDNMPHPRGNELLERVGTPEGENHIWLSPAVLRFLSPVGNVPEWNAGFEVMLRTAAKLGWIDDTGYVRAHISPSASSVRVSPDEFRGAMRRLAASVCAVTSGTLGDPVGMVASSAVSVSAEPPLAGFFIHETSSSLSRLREVGRFAINILDMADRELFYSFARQPQGSARFAGSGWQEGTQGLPVLKTALAVAECKLVSEVRLGTHFMLVGRLEKTCVGEGRPMIYFDGAILES